MLNDTDARKFAVEMVELEKETLLKITAISEKYGVGTIETIIAFANSIIDTAKRILEDFKNKSDKLTIEENEGGKS